MSRIHGRRCRSAGSGEQPGERGLTRGGSDAGGDLTDEVDDGLVGGERIGGRSGRSPAAGGDPRRLG